MANLCLSFMRLGTIEYGVHRMGRFAFKLVANMRVQVRSQSN
jgi:hypothetical protein